LSCKRARPLYPILTRHRCFHHRSKSAFADESNYIARQSTAPRGCADWLTVANRVIQYDKAIWSLIGYRSMACLPILGHPSGAGPPRPDRVMQLCHPRSSTLIPPLRTPKGVSLCIIFHPTDHASWTSIKRRYTARVHSLTTARDLTGAGGAGKTLLAIRRWPIGWQPKTSIGCVLRRAGLPSPMRPGVPSRSCWHSSSR